jgi:hypothetical protein
LKSKRCLPRLVRNEITQALPHCNLVYRTGAMLWHSGDSRSARPTRLAILPFLRATRRFFTLYTMLTFSVQTLCG